MFDLSGRHALVCGSSQGIGRASAELLARCGARITLLARDEAALAEVCRGLHAVKGTAHAFRAADFRRPEDVRRTAAEIVEQVGPVEILVNNTGGPSSGPILDARPEAFLEAATMHIACNQLLVQTCVPGMRQRGYGRIINIISTSVKQPIPGLGVSNTTRWAVAAWAKTLAGELGPFGITVNNVLPGFTSTARLRSLFEARSRREGIPVEQIEATAKAEIPLRRFATPEEIAAGVVFLASPAASYVNGINLPVDGGRLSTL
ncbi:3-oxoacyl-[acyl-carrier-protein] reductase FabG [Phycisphaerae bacterium RAS1]|nr:3-oxoacyl-[acyl-carrier-protein] reductase FabG [Phycisphaerae bacterium RAS1]